MALTNVESSFPPLKKPYSVKNVASLVTRKQSAEKNLSHACAAVGSTLLKPAQQAEQSASTVKERTNPPAIAAINGKHSNSKLEKLSTDGSTALEIALRRM